MSDVIISVENLGKKYRIRHQANQRSSYKTLREMVTDGTIDLIKRFTANAKSQGPFTSAFQSSREDFWALKDVSFEVKRGQALGIIGRNGAGKSTLLKILSRITEPSQGRVTLRGRVASLLEVGTGFHPELTGRENIFLNGAVMGMTKFEMRRKFDEIVAFAGVEKFLDTPVKRFSSGMYVRLAFAVAAHLEPEILIVDEVLAVGDAEFQKKCLGKMQDVARGDRTILFVSHNLGIIKSLCPTTVWIHDGCPRLIGPTSEVLNSYLLQNPSNIKYVDLGNLQHLYSDGRLRLRRFTWLSQVPPQHGELLRALIEFNISSPVDDLSVGIGFSSPEGVRLVTYETDFPDGVRVSLTEPGDYAVEVAIDALPLSPALYSVDLGCRSGDAYGMDYVPGATQLEIVPGPATPGHIVQQNGLRLPSAWLWRTPANPKFAEAEISSEARVPKGSR